jgi:uncharacterized protein (TIGR02246 family)
MRIALVLFVAAVFASACSPAPRSPDLAADEKAIRDLAARWQKALLERDAATQASMFADDGMSYHDSQPPLVGPAAILEWERSAVNRHPKAKITSKTTELRIAAAGDIAIQAGEGELTGLGENGEDHAIHRQRFLTIWKKVNGQWKVAHDMAVNTTPWP